MKTRSKASDDGGDGSPPPPNGREPIDDDQAMNKANELVIKLPFERRSCQLCLRHNKDNFMALSLNDEIRHAAERHAEIETVFICAKCGKRYTRKHAAICHIPKCPGQAPVVQYEHVCQVCGRSYKIKSGLSQHERHAHPATRNAARADGSASATPPKKQRNTKCSRKKRRNECWSWKWS